MGQIIQIDNIDKCPKCGDDLLIEIYPGGFVCNGCEARFELKEGGKK